MLTSDRIAFIGGGHITEIILRNLLRGQGFSPGQIVVSDRDPERINQLQAHFDITLAPDNAAAARQGDIILIAVRPDVVSSILPDLQAAALRPEQIVISLAAGIPLSRYACLGSQQPLARAIPNPPSQVGQGIVALAFAPQVTPEQRQVVRELFASLGQVVEVEEAYLNVITSLSNPAPVYMFFQAMIDAGVRGGLPRPTATQVAAQTIIGAMGVWQSRQVSPSELVAEASTPGGVSVESLFTLEQRAFKAIVMEAVARGAARAEELGKKAETG